MTVFNDLMKLLSLALNVQNHSKQDITDKLNELNNSGTEWEYLAALAKKNAVAGLLYEILDGYEGIPKEAMSIISRSAGKMCQLNYRFLVIYMKIKEVFIKEGIEFCILKGFAAAADYPVPDVRKLSDLDILLFNPDDLVKAKEALLKKGFKTEAEQHSLHHLCMREPEGKLVEMHTMFAEPFDDVKTNTLLIKLVPECRNQIRNKKIMDVDIPVLTDAYHAFELLMHMLQHFLLAGFGVRMLCDWVVLWNRGLDEKNRNEYMELVQKARVKGFSDAITRVCIKYLGLKRDNVLWMGLFDGSESREELDAETDELAADLFEAGEFGKTKGRMVALRGNGPFDYIREFHHQMHINFPKAGKCFLLWPVLWVITLVRFLRNNKKVRSVSSRELFDNAKKRGRLVKKLRIFK